MKPEHLHILQHSLGLDKYGRGSQYRNHFVTGPETTDWPLIQELVALKYMYPTRNHVVPATDTVFKVTLTGLAAMMKATPPPPRVSRSGLRYRQWLNADSGMSFREYNGWGRRRPKKPKTPVNPTETPAPEPTPKA